MIIFKVVYSILLFSELFVYSTKQNNRSRLWGYFYHIQLNNICKEKKYLKRLLLLTIEYQLITLCFAVSICQSVGCSNVKCSMPSLLSTECALRSFACSAYFIWRKFTNDSNLWNQEESIFGNHHAHQAKFDDHIRSRYDFIFNPRTLSEIEELIRKNQKRKRKKKHEKSHVLRKAYSLRWQSIHFWAIKLALCI